MKLDDIFGDVMMITLLTCFFEAVSTREIAVTTFVIYTVCSILVHVRYIYRK